MLVFVEHAIFNLDAKVAQGASPIHVSLHSILTPPSSWLRVPLRPSSLSSSNAYHFNVRCWAFDVRCFFPTFLHTCNLAALSFPLIHFFLFPIKNLKSSIGSRQCTPTSHGLHPHITRRSKRPSPKPILVIRDWSQSKCAADKAEYNITMDEKASGWLRRVDLLSTRVE